jgi:hypothetical protein
VELRAVLVARLGVAVSLAAVLTLPTIAALGESLSTQIEATR